MTHFTVEIADEAWREIESQIRFIAVDRQAPINAARWSNRLLNAIDDLELMPRRHMLDAHVSREHGTGIYRMVFEQTYLVFYTIDQVAHRVTIVSFRHGARDER